MLRKLLVLTISISMLGLLASSANAALFLPRSSTLQVQFGALPTIIVQGTYSKNGWADLSAGGGGGHDLTDSASVWVTQGNAVGTSLLTGVALLSRLTLTETNLSGSFVSGFSTGNPIGGGLTAPSSTPNSGTLCPGGCLGGTEGFNGQFILGVLGGPLPFALTDSIGIGGSASLVVPGLGTVFVTAAPFITGKARITGITTNVVSIPSRNGGNGVTGVGVTLAPAGTENVRTFTTLGGFVTTFPQGVLLTRGTVTVGGTNALGSATASGQVTLISPLRINTGPLAVGNIPGFFEKKFTFAQVPEPGTMLLLVSGAAGLVFIGRKRMKG